MTTSAPVAQLWSTMPGWGIAADLTPPELVNARELKRLRRWLAAGLVLLVLLGVGGYVTASIHQSNASSSLDKVQARTRQLQASIRTYAGVTQIQGDLAQIKTQVAALLASDVDLTTLINRIQLALPTSMTISSESILISTSGATTVTSPSGAQTIGAVTVAGAGKALKDLATFAENLAQIPGVVDVNPTSNVLSTGTAHYTVTLNLTADALSHRFDATPSGSK